MIGWHHQLSGPEFEQTPGVAERQGSLACYSPWGCKEQGTIEQLKNRAEDIQSPTLFSVNVN